MKVPVEKRLHELGNGIFAYTQLPGSWGWSNAGLITDGDQSLLVDTLFDKKLTAEMLESMRRASPAAARIGTVVNTHGNGDHCYGNALVADAAPMATSLFADFDFTNNDVVLPNRTFERELTLMVGDKRVELIEVGPAHTLGDAIVWVPEDRTVFTGDILFKDAHPVIWEGPVSNWVAACERLLDMDIETVVPGHGPLTDKSALRETLRYLEALTEQARSRYDAGMSVEDAAHEVAFEEFDHWIDAERVYVNVHTLYREFSGDTEPADILALFAGMARLQARKALSCRA
jgi:glyoxylase-like metal-dependent hydrolase (beta-lactamase superfamily II)